MFCVLDGFLLGFFLNYTLCMPCEEGEAQGCYRGKPIGAGLRIGLSQALMLSHGELAEYISSLIQIHTSALTLDLCLSYCNMRAHTC